MRIRPVRPVHSNKETLAGEFRDENPLVLHIEVMTRVVSYQYVIDEIVDADCCEYEWEIHHAYQTPYLDGCLGHRHRN